MPEQDFHITIYRIIPCTTPITTVIAYSLTVIWAWGRAFPSNLIINGNLKRLSYTITFRTGASVTLTRELIGPPHRLLILIISILKKEKYRLKNWKETIFSILWNILLTHPYMVQEESSTKETKKDGRSMDYKRLFFEKFHY